MTLAEFCQELRSEVTAIFAPTSSLQVSATTTVPNVEDAGFTLATGADHKAKSLRTCVLFIDIRNSTQLNFAHSAEELARLYSAFITTMLRAAEFYGGYVRNINGDRVMVVFDEANCFVNALQTAALLNTVAHKLLAVYFKGSPLNCGIGIDYGEMLVVKTGTIKRGKENQFYKSFVWLGKPANLASKLTDLANKDNFLVRLVRQGFTLRRTGLTGGNPLEIGTVTSELRPDEMLTKLTKSTASSAIQYDGWPVHSWTNEVLNKYPILLTQEVAAGLTAAAPNSAFITKQLLLTTTIKVKGYTGQVYGSHAYYPDVL